MDLLEIDTYLASRSVPTKSVISGQHKTASRQHPVTELPHYPYEYTYHSGESNGLPDRWAKDFAAPGNDAAATTSKIRYPSTNFARVLLRTDNLFYSAASRHALGLWPCDSIVYGGTVLCCGRYGVPAVAQLHHATYSLLIATSREYP